MKIQMEGFHKLHDDLEKVIEKEDSTSSVTSDSDETKQEFSSFRERLKYILHTHKFQIIIICFVVLDCLLVISELLLDLKILPTSEDNIAPHILHYASIGILSLFIIELLVRLYVFRLEFFCHKMELFDAMIIIISFVLDIIFRNTRGPENGTGLLIVLRLWRVTRILNGIILSVKKQAEKKIQRERRLRDACEQELTKYREYCMAQEKENEALRLILRKHGISDVVPSELPRPVSRISVVAEVNQLPEKTAVNKLETNERKQEVPSAAAM